VSAAADATGRAALDVIRPFNEAFNRHDVDGVMALMTADCVFENTFPAPDGQRFVTEEAFAAGDRCVVRWTFHWDEAGGHVRGVDVFRVRDGKVAEKLAYVKG
jgi:ketosteroid isomerase-like protein